MANQPSREDIRKRVAESTKDAVILEEMKRFGFWKEELSPELEDILQKQKETETELNTLVRKQTRYRNPETLRKEMLKERMKASKQKRQEAKERKEQKRLARAETWKKRKETEVLYLGEDVSSRLSETEPNLEFLAKWNLPNIENPLALANALSLKLSQLRFLTYNRKVSLVNHYKRFYIPKKMGGKRLISAPMPLIKSAQLWILNNILYLIPHTDQAHGFIPQRSIVSNAAQHVGKELVLNLDLKDFFPSISFSRVKGLFQSFGYSGQISTLLALLCTEAEVEQVAIDGKKYFVSIGERTLPQGSPCSPAISNLIAYKLDRRLQGIANKWGFVYTRYADDLSFSCGSDNLDNFQQLLWSVQEVVKSEGFTVHPEKIHIMRKGSRQEVTGLIVNRQIGIERKELHRFRALLQQIEKNGPAGKTWNGNPNLENSMRGYASFVMMVKPELGIRFMKKIDSIF